MTPPGTIIAIHAQVQVSNYTAEAVGYCVVLSPIWRDEPVYCCKPDKLANGMLVRRLVNGRVFNGVQMADGSLLGENGPARPETETEPKELDILRWDYGACDRSGIMGGE